MRLLFAFAIALPTAAALTPLARRVALASGLLDRPAGWKTHMHPTPFLGGAAVLAGVAAGSLLAPDLRTLALVLGPALLLSAVGTLDDAVHLDVRLRLVLELAAGCFLWAFDLGWNLDAPELVNLALTCGWVLVVINAFNILDLMDAVAASVLIATAVGLALLAQIEGQATAAVISIAVAGAALGFLPFNLTPSRIFLGDCGTMPLGFLVAALVVLALDGAKSESGLILAAPLLFGVPLADAIWRALKRVRAGVSLMTAGHDSIANSLQRRFVSPPRVALLLAVGQALASGLALIAIESGAVAEVVAAVAISCVGLIALRGMLSGSLRRRVVALLLRE